MRSPIVALCLAVLTGIGFVAAPAPAQAAASEAKVVIIVGATHDATEKYRESADVVYAEAIKYTSDVTKVYSPNATWSKVKAAVVDANIVVYLGHGNGCPSPYPCSAPYTTKNGFGLNASAGDGDHNNKYYGEPYVSTLDLAPNAVIILNRLCYAAGNSEPGDPDPTESTAKKRVDNYGSAFLEAGAGAVIAEGHGSAADHIRALFTTSGSIVDAWASAGSNGNEFSFAGTRSAGATIYMDPEKPGKYYRSLVTKPDLTTGMVVEGAAVPDPYPGTPFTDIGTSSFADDIAWLYDAEITTGCADSLYCPNGTVTRGQMASFLARALELPPSDTDHFEDDDGTTHEPDIDRVAAAGITSGCGPDAFCPDAKVTRAEMASFLARALALPTTSTDHFSDDDGMTHEKNIDRLASAALTSGCAATKFCPKDAVTRGQMAAFLHRAFGD